METDQQKCEKTKSSIMKKLESYLSLKGGGRTKPSPPSPSSKKLRRQVTPTGCFSVCVGPEKQRFVIKTEFANHPLFKMLLEDAESEYGFQNEGPLCLPCDAELFYQVLTQIMNGNKSTNCADEDKDGLYRGKAAFGHGHYCSPFNNPARRLSKRSETAMGANKGCGSYGLLTPPRLSSKIRQFQTYA